MFGLIGQFTVLLVLPAISGLLQAERNVQVAAKAGSTVLLSSAIVSWHVSPFILENYCLATSSLSSNSKEFYTTVAPWWTLPYISNKNNFLAHIMKKSSLVAIEQLAYNFPHCSIIYSSRQWDKINNEWSNTINREMIVSTKFRICNFCVQIIWILSQPSKILKHRKFSST